MDFSDFLTVILKEYTREQGNGTKSLNINPFKDGQMICGKCNTKWSNKCHKKISACSKMTFGEVNKIKQR